MNRGSVLFIALLLADSQAAAQSQRVLTTLAGTDWLFPADGLPATKAPLNNGLGLDIATDRAGTLYICDVGNEMVLRVGRNGIISVVAGNGMAFPSGDGGLAVNAGLGLPFSVTVDAAGNLYIGEYGGRIRKVTTTGIITTIAGGFEGGFAGDGGPAIQAQFDGITGLAADGSGSVYVADSTNKRIRKITPDGLVHTIAGGGASSNDYIAATAAKLVEPDRIALDAAGNLFISDAFDQRVRKVDANGIISTVAGGGSSFADGVPATSEALLPGGIALDSSGNIYLVDLFNSRVRKVDQHGIISTVAGSGKQAFSGDGGPALEAALYMTYFSSLATTSAGDLLIADDSNGRVRRVGPDGNINTIAGNGLFRFSGDGGAAIAATINLPTGLTGDKAGNIYFAEPFAKRVRRIAPDGAISVIAGTGGLGYSGDGGPATAATLGIPEYVAVAPDGSVVFSDAFDCVIRSVDMNGIISTIVGSGLCGSSADLETAAKSALDGPQGVDFDTAGDLLFADAGNNRIRGVIATGADAGKVITIAGNGTAGYSGDGGLGPNKAQINKPSALRAHGNGVYFCDTGNNVVRYVDFGTGLITTVAGTGKAGYSGDGGSATGATLNSPSGLDFDQQGNMYIADTDNSAIRKVDTNGVISTYAGSYSGAAIGDGLDPLKAFIGGPLGLYLRPNGDLIFADIYYERVRAILTILPKVSATPASLAFTAAAGAQSLNQSLNILGSIAGIPYSVSDDAESWLSLSASMGNTPATVGITVDPASLSPGSYTGTITVATPNATPHSIGIPVSLTVTAPGAPSLSLNPASVTFPLVQGSQSSSRSITVSNVGGGTLPFVVTTRTNSGGGWLQASPASATLSAFGSSTATVTANPAALPAATYQAVVTIASADGVQVIVVPVTMTVTAVSQTIQIPETGLSFTAVQGGGSPPPQNIHVLNSGAGQMSWTASASTLRGGNWLSTFPPTGLTDAASQLVPEVRVSVDPGGLQAGTYYGMIQVAALGASNSPQVVSIILSVLPPGANLGPILQPSGLIFAAVAAGESPGSQIITLQSTNSSPVNFSSGMLTSDGSDWIRLVPASGTITASAPAHVVIQPDIAGLEPGFHRGSVTFSFSDGSTRTVSILLVLVAAPGSSPTVTNLSDRGVSVRDAQASCFPTKLAPIFTGLADGASVRLGYPGVIQVQVVDDCANPMTSGSVIAAFSNGDPPLPLTSLKNGAWAATWVVGHPAPQIVVKANAAIPPQKLSGQTQITVGSQGGDLLPVISPDGVVNGASFASLAPVAPGSIVAVFGSKLAQNQISAMSTPLPVDLAGSFMVIAGRQTPLFFASDGQVNAVVPYETPINTQQQVIASRASALSVPQPVTIAAAAPGIFTLDGKQGIVVDIDSTGQGTLVDANHAAKGGDVLVIYCTGLGEVDPPIATGSPAPLTPLSQTTNTVTVTIGGVNADVLFSGLTPTEVGLYQVNVRIPSGISGGPAVPLLVTAAGLTSAPVTINIK